LSAVTDVSDQTYARARELLAAEGQFVTIDHVMVLAICGGLGLLLDALCGRRLPGALVAPAGFAALVLVAGAMTLAEATEPYAASLAIVLAGVGAVASLPWRFGRPDPWLIAAALAVFALFAAPVVLSGDPTFASYGELADNMTWLAIASGDPSGPVLPLAAVQRLLGGEVAWHLQPYLALLGALLSLCAWQLAGRALEDPRPRSLVAFLAATPALVFGYAGWGGAQELAAATLLALAAALTLPLWREAPLHLTEWAPLTIAVLALLIVLAPFPPPLSLDLGTLLATVALTGLIAAAAALGVWLATAHPPAALLLFAAALTACAAIASANASLAPYDRLVELGQIDERFSDRGPALLFEPSPYSEYFLRDLDLSERTPSDPDQIDFRALLAYPLLVQPRSPEQSRPPLPYRRQWRGERYEVWQLPPVATFRLLFHMAIGAPGAPAALPDCSQVVGLGLLALSNQLGALPQQIPLIAAAPRRGSRLGPTVAVPVDRASELCGRRWDWIEAIAPAG
jgi:hypothetical protein